MTSTAPRRLGLLAVAVAGAWLGTRLVAGGQGRRQARTAPWPPVPPVPRPAPMPTPVPAPTPLAQAPVAQAPVTVTKPEPEAVTEPEPEVTEAVTEPEPEVSESAAPGRTIIVPPPPPAPAPASADEAPAPVRRQRVVTVAAATPGAVLTRPLPPDEVVADEPATGDLPAWVEPIDTVCPPTHPVKAKLSSHLYHLPGMLAYRRTHPDRCYRDAEAAERDGFVRAKR